MFVKSFTFSVGVRRVRFLVAVFGFMIFLAAAISVSAVFVLVVLRVLAVFVGVVVLVFHDFLISFFFFLSKAVFRVCLKKVRALRLQRADAILHAPDPLYTKGIPSTPP